ncbi:SET domain-containing protein [Hymenopellis radicata]|nr:SET domain-containing protein [Hymenopellis radicata]
MKAFPLLENADLARSGETFKMPYGNIDGLKYDPNIIPEGVNLARPSEVVDANETYKGLDDKGSLISTSQPSVNVSATLQSEPDGWTECLVRPSVKRRILSTPGFPAPLNRVVPPAHRTGPSPSGGLGMFAARPLEAGDLIFAERAIIIVPNGQAQPVASHLKGKDLLRAFFLETEKTLEIAYERLLPELQERYMALSNCHENDGSGPILGRLRTNAFGITPLAPESEIPYSGVFDVLSRINHSCGPNTDRHFDMKTFSMKLYAVRDIKEGEEITTSYCDLEVATAARQKALAPYDFKCACPHCSDPSSDTRRARMLKEFDSRINSARLRMWLGNTRLPDDLLVKETEEALKVMEREGLEGSAYYSSNLVHMCAIYSALNNDATAFKRYKARLLKLWIAAGDDLQQKIAMFKAIVVPLEGAREKAKKGILNVRNY